MAFDDAYNWVGNTVLDTSARGLATIISNDTAPTDSFTLSTTPTSGSSHGSLTISANGHFVYTPTAGYTGDDSLTYTISNSADNTLTSTATVTIHMPVRVWYAQAGASGDGRSNTPSGSPSAISTAANSSSDVIYVFSSASTTIGASGLTFRSISAGTGTSAGARPANGIFLFNMKAVSLSWMQINDNQNYAIYGNTVNGFTLDNSVVSGMNGNNDVRDEGSIAFDNLLLSGSLTNSNISGGWEDNLRLRNNTGTLNRLTIDTDTWEPNSSVFGNAALNMQVTSGSPTMNMTVNNCTFTGSRTHFVQLLPNGSGAPNMDFVFTGNTITNSMASIAGAGGVFVNSSGGGNLTLTFNVSNNTQSCATSSNSTAGLLKR